MFTKLIGVALLVFLIWFLRLATKPREPNIDKMSTIQRNEPKRQLKKKPYNPRFSYEPKVRKYRY